MKIESFNRHKSSIAFIAAKYPTIIMYFLSSIFLFIPYVGVLAWVIAFLFFFKEESSEFLRLHAAQIGFIMMLYSVVTLILAIIGDFILSSANSSRSEVAIINALTIQGYLGTAVRILRIIVLILAIVNAVLAYRYKFCHYSVFGKMAKRLHEKTKRDF